MGSDVLEFFSPAAAVVGANKDAKKEKKAAQAAEALDKEKRNALFEKENTFTPLGELRANESSRNSLFGN